MSDTLKIQIVIAITAIITTYLTVKYKDVVLNKANASPTKDRMEQIFEGYEKLIVQQQEDIERKNVIITNLETIVEQLRKDLDRTSAMLTTARLEVEKATKQNKQLKGQLEDIRLDYKAK